MTSKGIEGMTGAGNAGKLPKGIVIGYALPRFGAAVIFLSVVIYLPKFCTDTLMLAPAFIGWMFLLGRVWDGITDPAMGVISDRTRFKMGRRRPYFLISAIPIGVCYFLLWSPPSGLTDWMLFVYLTVCYLATYTFFTMFSIPYESLVAELTTDYNERTLLTGVREGLGLLGALAATLAPPITAAILRDVRASYSLVAGITGIITAAFILICFFKIRENPSFQRESATSGLEGFKLIFKNRPFLILISVLMVALVGSAFVPILTLYVGDYLIQKPTVAPIVIISYLLTAAFSIVVWTRLSSRIGKKRTLFNGLILSALVYTMTIYYHQGTWVLWIILAIMAGAGYGCILALAPSMMADVIDFDELESGDRREGVYFGVWLFVQKASVGITTFIGMQVLAGMGYVPNVQQSAQVLLSIKFLYCVLPALCFIIGAVLIRLYPIDPSEYRRIRSLIDQRDSRLGSAGNVTD